MPSVEASQLSRALTLAEMTVRDAQTKGTTQADCACVLGRADLAFINVGYQVKTLSGTANDASNLPTTVTAADEATQKALAENNPITPSMMATNRAELITKVDKFLFTLYDALDRPHTEYEEAIRGANLPQGKLEKDVQAWRFEKPVSEYGPLEPPFSSPNRAALGDPEATLQQYSSARADIKKQWEDFGDKLQSNAKKARLKQEIANLERELGLKYQQRQQLVAKGDAEGLAKLDAAIAKQSQELAQKQQELAIEVSKTGEG
jgi:hypothetical protein